MAEDIEKKVAEDPEADFESSGNGIPWFEMTEASKGMKYQNVNFILMQDPEYQHDFWDVRAGFMPPVDVLNINEDVAPPEDGYIAPIEIAKEICRKAAYRFKVHRCPCRDSMGCKDYPHELGCIFFGKATLDLDPALGKQISVEEALEHLDKLQAADLSVHVGHVPWDQPAFGISRENRNKFMSLCGCCPCCSITRFVPSYRNMPGLRLAIDVEKCIGCGTCAETCGYKGIIMEEGASTPSLLQNNCKACGRCVHKCPTQALEIRVIDPEYFQKSLEWISTYTDIATFE